MDASDLIKALQNYLARRGGRAHIMANVGSSDLPLSARRSINLFNRLKQQIEACEALYWNDRSERPSFNSLRLYRRRQG
jgi:hypothetical protein